MGRATTTAVLLALAAGSAAGQGGATDPIPLGQGYAQTPAPRNWRAAGQAPADEPSRLPPAPAPAVPLPLTEPTSVPPPPPPVVTTPEVFQAGCKSCGAPLGPADLLGGSCSACGGAGGCIPGRTGCSPCEAHTRVGQFFCCLYECLCCPDPCYEPKWVPMADAGFFTAAARPVTQSRFRGSVVQRLGAPDRSEWFWARADGNGKGPAAPPGAAGERSVSYSQFSMYTEAATGMVSVFTDVPYRSISPELGSHAAGFSDITIGTKTLLYDCELLQFAFQFSTTLPAGNFLKGLGTGHVSLEPSAILGLKLSPSTFLQMQVAQWIPIGGDPGYQGSVLHTHTSLNQVLCRPLPDVPVIAVFEVNTHSFQDGAYTDPVLGSFQRSGEETYVTLGPGLRVSVCDRVDFGVGSAFAVGNRLAPAQELRFEVRARY